MDFSKAFRSILLRPSETEVLEKFYISMIVLNTYKKTLGSCTITWMVTFESNCTDVLNKGYTLHHNFKL